MEIAPATKTFLALRIAVRSWRSSGSLPAILLAMFSCAGCVPVPAAQIQVETGRPSWTNVYRMHPGTSVLLNNAKLTPGAVRTTKAADVCSGESTRDFRKTTAAMKAAVYKAYGVARTRTLPGDPVPADAKKPYFEIDHLISLELGGADDVKNLWPQPYYQHPGAHEKDAVENYLHRKVCGGQINLTDAQKAIANDWYDVYLQMQKEKESAELMRAEPQWDGDAEMWRCAAGLKVPAVTFAGWRCVPEAEEPREQWAKLD